MKTRKILAGIGALLLLLIAAALLTDWRFLRGPVERMASDKLGRPVTLGDFRMHLRPVTRIHLGQLQVANVPEGAPEQMARIDTVDLGIRVLPLLRRAVTIETLGVSGGEIHLARDKSGKNNWTLPDTDDDGPPLDVTVRSLALDTVDVYYGDQPLGVDAHVRASTQTGQPAGSPYGLKLDFDGKYRGGPFAGSAFTGGILTLKDSGTPFPFLIDGKGGSTHVRAEGQIGDILGDAQVDVALDISSATLSSLYPFINLPLPDTPPYRLKGRLHREGMNFRLTGIDGRIGSTDIAGDASYEKRAERPMLTAHLKSRVLDMKDLGPVIGSKPESKAPAPKDPAAQKPAADPNRRVLPDSEFRIGRLNAMDADVTLDAGSVRVQGPWAFDDFSTHVLLDDGVLKLAPLNFGYAGGSLRSDITLDARQTVIRTEARIALQKAQLSRLFPNVELMKKSDGTLGADIRLKSSGNSIRTMLGRADGTLGLAVTGGDLSNLLIEAIGLDAGQAIGYLVGGDRKTRIRCAVSTMDVDDGLAKVKGLVIDTEDTRINGTGSIDLGEEKIDLRLTPLPKDKSILAIRSPINIVGTFGDPGFEIDKLALFTRAGAALALGLINPLAALIPLIETGPGTDADCQALLADVGGAAKNSKTVPDKKR